MIIADENNIMMVHQTLIYGSTLAWKVETDEKNKKFVTTKK